MNYTENYNLPQWVKEDRIMMEDFNAAMSSIEDGLTGAQSTADMAKEAASKLPYVVGSYVGDGTSGRHITLGFRPSFVIVGGQDKTSASAAALYFIATAGTASSDMFIMTDTGFQVKDLTNWYPNLNTRNRPYDYIAFR